MTEAVPAARHVRPWNGLTIPAAGIFALDPAHANVGFTVRHMMVTKVRGRFADVTATLRLGVGPDESSVDVVIDTASVTTGQDDRDAHLRSGDFFDVENYPRLTFRSTRITHVEDNEFVLAGDLAIRDVTRPVEFEATFDGVGVNPWGAQVVGFSARTEIDREQWGLTWNATLESGGVLVGRKIVLEIDAEFNRGSAASSPKLANG